MFKQFVSKNVLVVFKFSYKKGNYFLSFMEPRQPRHSAFSIFLFYGARAFRLFTKWRSKQLIYLLCGIVHAKHFKEISFKQLFSGCYSYLCMCFENAGNVF